MPADVDNAPLPSRFTTINEFIRVDEEVNGDVYVDVYKPFVYPSAQNDLNETREKLYLKVLQTICGSLNSDDAEFELQEKAVHTIANEYIKNRKAGDILLEELRGYDEQMGALETALIEESQLVERLEKARQSDRSEHERCIAEMCDLE